MAVSGQYEQVALAVGNLPAANTTLTSFRGRRTLLETVRKRLSETRLVTLTGAGGTGKTRTAAEFGHQVRAAFPGGVYSAELVSSRDADESEHTDIVHRAVAHALNLRRMSQGDPLTAIFERLAADDRMMLIILDNAEHMRDAVAVLAATLLRAAPHVHILVTSLEMLHVPGEAAIEVPPLALPTATGGVDLTNESVSLLVDRAAGPAPGWQITEDNWPAVVTVLHGVAGIPLAIELVAARLRSMSIEIIAERLDSIFGLLTGGGLLVPTHHQTLRSAVDWSYNLCTPAEQELWARLSVFSGGWTLEAAEQVCGYGSIAAEDIADHLAGLVGKSIVTPNADRSRYSLLQPLLIYGLNRLADVGQVDHVRLRHRDWAAALVAHAADTWLGPAEFQVMRKVWNEWDNLMAAMAFSVRAEPESEIGLVIAMDLLRTRVPWLRGRIPEARKTLRTMIVATKTPPSPLRTTAIALGSWVTLCQGDLSGAAAILTEALESAGALPDSPMLPALRFAQGSYRMLSLGALDSLDMLEEARQAFVAMDAPGEADMAGTILAIGGALIAPTEEQSVAIALEHLDRNYAHGSPWATAWAQMIVSMAYVRWGHYEDAAKLLDTSLRAMRYQDDRWGTLWNVETHAWLHAHRVGSGESDDPVRTARDAARLLGAAMRLQQLTDIAISGMPSFDAQRKASIAHVHSILSTKDYKDHYEKGLRTDTYDNAIALALGEYPPPPSSKAVSPVETRTPQGEIVLTPPVGKGLLTEAEWKVAELAATGMTNQEIARKLFLSKRTVDSHLRSIYPKLNIQGRVNLAHWVTEWFAKQQQ